MTDIIKLAREAGFHVGDQFSSAGKALERFAELVAAQEREACIQACEDVMAYDPDNPAETFKNAIRARTKPKS